MNSEEKIAFTKLKDEAIEMRDSVRDFAEMKESVQLIKRAIMGDLKDNSKGILENIRKLQEETVETREAIKQLKEKNEISEQNSQILQDAIKKLDKLNKDFESLSKYRWIVLGVFAAIGYLLTNISDFLTLIKNLLGMKS
jgi:NTP pyrophosphatase (non-canonical NTP hydrolase)